MRYWVHSSGPGQAKRAGKGDGSVDFTVTDMRESPTQRQTLMCTIQTCMCTCRHTQMYTVKTCQVQTYTQRRHTAGHMSAHITYSQLCRRARRRYHRPAKDPGHTQISTLLGPDGDHLSQFPCTPAGSAGRLGHRAPHASARQVVNATSTWRHKSWGWGSNTLLG